MCAAKVDLRSMSHSPSPLIEANNNLVDRKTGLPYHQHKNVIGMKGTTTTTGNGHYNGTSSSHVQVYQESSISRKPTNGLHDQVPQQSHPPQMYSVSLAFKTPKLHYSNQLYIYPYYVVTFCETAKSQLETDVAPPLEKQIKYCNVFYFDLHSSQTSPPQPEEEEEEEEEWTEFYEEVHHTTVITETKTESAAAYHAQQHAAAQQTSIDEVMYTDSAALPGANIHSLNGATTTTYGATTANATYGTTTATTSETGGGTSSLSRGGGGGSASAYEGPSLSDVISLDNSASASLDATGASGGASVSASGGGNKNKNKRRSKGGGSSGNAFM